MQTNADTFCVAGQRSSPSSTGRSLGHDSSPHPCLNPRYLVTPHARCHGQGELGLTQADDLWCANQDSGTVNHYKVQVNLVAAVEAVVADGHGKVHA